MHEVTQAGIAKRRDHLIGEPPTGQLADDPSHPGRPRRHITTRATTLMLAVLTAGLTVPHTGQLLVRIALVAGLLPNHELPFIDIRGTDTRKTGGKAKRGRSKMAMHHHIDQVTFSNGSHRIKPTGKPHEGGGDHLAFPSNDPSSILFRPQVAIKRVHFRKRACQSHP
jgi:hypothetical protein